MSGASEPLSPARSAGALGVGELRPLVPPELSPGDAEVGTGCEGTRANEWEQKEDGSLNNIWVFHPLKITCDLGCSQVHRLQLTRLEVWVGGDGVVQRCCLLGMGWTQEVGQQYSGSAAVNVQEIVQYGTKPPKGSRGGYEPSPLGLCSAPAATGEEQVPTVASLFLCEKNAFKVKSETFFLSHQPSRGNGN